jgi:predicted PurR-regulated permease PerM
MNKKAWLDVAEVIDTLRIFPRLMVLAYGIWVAWFTDWFVAWFERIPSAERTAQVTAIFGIVIPGVLGLATWVFRMYLDGGRDWDKQKPQDTP